MTKAEDEALADSYKYGSGPLDESRGGQQGSVEWPDKYGVAPLVVAEADAKAESVPPTTKPAESASKKES